MLTCDDVTFQLTKLTDHGEETQTVRLRPTLRAGLRLLDRYDDFEPVEIGIVERSLSVLADVIECAALEEATIPDIIRTTGFVGMKRVTSIAAEASARFVMALLAIDGDDDTKGKTSGESIPMREFFKRLYRLGTGWLGWTPDQTLDATPAQIIEAYRGRVDLMKAVFGDGEKREQEDAFGAQALSSVNSLLWFTESATDAPAP